MPLVSYVVITAGVAYINVLPLHMKKLPKRGSIEESSPLNVNRVACPPVGHGAVGSPERRAMARLIL